MSSGIRPAELGVMQSPFQRQSVWLKPALAGLMAGLALLLALVASSESLHHQLHGNSADGQSLCAICSVVRGQLDAPASASPEAAVKFFGAWTLPHLESAKAHPVDGSVASSRDPPASFSSL
ncbi:MAG: hypothetical protein KBH45_05875 [Verrucomicrobia bacterium]|nr:hypothetical protein [Verrucomicrobiota bacterium]